MKAPKFTDTKKAPVIKLGEENVVRGDLPQGRDKRELIYVARLDRQVTIRRACSMLQFDRSTYRHQSRRTNPILLKKRTKDIRKTHDQLARPGASRLSDDIGQVLAAKAGARSSVQFPWRRLSCDVGTGVEEDRLPEDNRRGQS